MRSVAEFARFLIAGGANTAVTYAVYLLLLRVVPYPWAYSLAFVAGVVLSLLLNAGFVFGVRPGRRAVIAYPLIYVLQYGLGLLVTEVVVRRFDVPASFAPLFAIAVTVPTTFLLSRRLLRGKVPSRRA